MNEEFKKLGYPKCEALVHNEVCFISAVILLLYIKYSILVNLDQ